MLFFIDFLPVQGLSWLWKFIYPSYWVSKKSWPFLNSFLWNGPGLLDMLQYLSNYLETVRQPTWNVNNTDLGTHLFWRTVVLDSIRSQHYYYQCNNFPYCLSKKSWLILYSKLLYKLGQDLLDIQCKARVNKCSGCPLFFVHFSY